MYCAYVTKLKNVRKHPNADRLVLADVFDSTVVVGANSTDGDVVIYFPCDGQLSVDYCKENDLVRRKDENGNNVGGFLDPDKRNVKAIKLRGERSDGLVMPLNSVAYINEDLPNQLTSMKNAFTEQATKVCDLYKTYFKFLKSKSYEDEKIRNRVETNLLEKKNELEIERAKVEYADTFMTERFEKFVINLNIIAHIRNALAHGNIKLRPYTSGDTFADRELIIEDIHEGKMTYRKIIKVRDFIQLFSSQNASLVEETIIGRIVKIKLEEAKGVSLTKK